MKKFILKKIDSNKVLYVEYLDEYSTLVYTENRQRARVFSFGADDMKHLYQSHVIEIVGGVKYRDN